MPQGDTIFEGERIAQYPEKPDVKWIVTKWRRLTHGIEAVEGRKAKPEELDRIRARENRPNVEFRDGDQDYFICRTCMVTFERKGGIVIDPCPGCGTHVGFIKRSYERNRLATAR